jgi:hypothetical protein
LPAERFLVFNVIDLAIDARCSRFSLVTIGVSSEPASTSGAKARIVSGPNGTAKAVPYPKAIRTNRFMTLLLSHP